MENDRHSSSRRTGSRRAGGFTSRSELKVGRKLTPFTRLRLPQAVRTTAHLAFGGTTPTTTVLMFSTPTGTTSSPFATSPARRVRGPDTFDWASVLSPEARAGQRLGVA